MTNNKIERFVQDIIEKYDLDVPIDLEGFCLELNISIHYIDNMNYYGSRALLLADKRMRIYISNKTSVLDVRHIIARELGHILLHEKYFTKGAFCNKFTIKMEIEADYFALCLLMPKKQFSEYIKNNGYEIRHIKAISSEFLVSEKAATIRCNSLNIFDTSKEYEILLFFSFDLVNSTFLKTRKDAINIWPYIIEAFYKEIHVSIKREIPDIEIWKYLGDEILLFFSIENINNLKRSPEIAIQVQETVVKILNDKFNNFNLNIKTTMWIAGIHNIYDYPENKYQDEIYRNIEIKFTDVRTSARDFVGPDMDIGFRISKYSNKSKITLSCELAYILKNICGTSISKKLYIVSHEELKGIWDNHLYPIIWYSNDWKNVRKSFDYDEYKMNEIVNKIIYHKNNALIHINELDDIFKYLKYDNFYNNLLKEIKLIIH